MFIFRQLFDARSHAFMYLLGDRASGEAVAIDVVPPPTLHSAFGLLAELDLHARYLLLTHAHRATLPLANTFVERSGARVAGSPVDAPTLVEHALEHGAQVDFGPEHVDVIATPGHTLGSASYLWRDRLFTGDALLIGGCGRPQHPAVDPARLYDSVVHRLFSLPGETLVFPGHDHCGRTVSTVAEERETNPAFAHRSRDEFITRRRDGARP